MNNLSNAITRIVGAPILVLLRIACVATGDARSNQAQMPASAVTADWEVDFLDDFDRFDPENWQDQQIWVNNEQQCYVPDGRHGTREVSEGTLRMRVVDLGAPVECDVLDKQGKQHPPTRWVAGRIISKNRHEFVKGRWTARLRVQGSGQPGMFPAWWLLGARNNEPPLQDADETVCWPMTGSGEIDIFEHHSDGGPDHYAARAIKSDGTCGGGDWQALMHVQAAALAEWHEYAVEWEGSDLRFLLDGTEVHRSAGQGDAFPEPLFALLNFAKINPAPMTVPSWTMEVDWVKHERLRPVHAQTSTAALMASCNAPTIAEVVYAAARTERNSRAYWLDRATIQWPGVGEGRVVLYRSERAALRADSGSRVTGASEAIALQPLTSPLAPGIAERFKFIGAGPRFALPEAARTRIGELLLDQLILVREDAEGRVLDATEIQLPGALDDRFAPAVHAPDLGPTFRAQEAAVALWAPTARNVSLCVYPSSTAPAERIVAMERENATGIWRAAASRDLRGRAYLFLVEAFVPGVGVVRNRVTDPYATALTADSKRSVFLSLDDPRTLPRGWRRAARPRALTAATDLTVYELHVRDFSLQDSTVRALWRGKYLAFAEPRSAGMSHLRLLARAGMTDVHLLPVYDLASIPESGCVNPQVPTAAPDAEAQQAAISPLAERDCFNWGYDPFHYSVPEGSYATNADDGATRIREFRQMVMALHAVGLRVGLDVVYNHTMASGQDALSVLDRIVPGYYQRLNATGGVERSTCCYNTATEHAMMAKLMIESAVRWVRYYGIDSFRFDLMGHQPRGAMERLQVAVDSAAGRHIPLVGEGWNFGEIANGARFVQASQLSLQGSGIATFSDRARDGLRGGGCCDGGEGLVANQGLLNGLHYAPNAVNTGRDRRAELLRAADLARVGLAGTLRDYEMLGADGVRRPLSAFDYGGGPAGFALEPGEVVNYVENHDNLTLFDLNALRLPRDISREERTRAQMVGVAFTAFSQGVAYFHAGVEVLRSKSLDRNSFNSGDWFNRLDWSYRDNGFGGGVPRAEDNRAEWPLMKPVLADARIKPAPSDIRWMRDASLDLLRIRSSSTLFRMRSAADVQRRLRFVNVGPSQNPVVLGALLDGEGYEGAGYRELLYLINVSGEAQELVLPEAAGREWMLHPVQRSPSAVDARARQARLDGTTGRVSVPARTAVVFVRE